MGKRKAKKKQNRKKYILDTSFQLERIKFPEIEKEIDKLTSLGDVCTSYFCLYEFRKGLISSLIDYYALVELTGNTSRALMKWSDKWGRSTKYLTIFQGVIHRIEDSISTKDIKKYLRLVEASILMINTIFETKVKLFVADGDFCKNDVVRHPLLSSEDYKSFKKACLESKIIPLDNFWSKNSSDLKSLIEDNELKKNYKKLHGRLVEIGKDIKNANKVRINQGIGDAVISVEMPKKYSLVTMDKSFEFLCPPIGKDCIRYTKTK